ncbi:hypothetical protein LguiA_016244 [Lonicera macranthoides]
MARSFSRVQEVEQQSRPSFIENNRIHGVLPMPRFLGLLSHLKASLGEEIAGVNRKYELLRIIV